MNLSVTLAAHKPVISPTNATSALLQFTGQFRRHLITSLVLLLTYVPNYLLYMLVGAVLKNPSELVNLMLTVKHVAGSKN